MSCSSLVHSFLVREIQFSIYHDRLGAFEFSLRPPFFRRSFSSDGFNSRPLNFYHCKSMSVNYFRSAPFNSRTSSRNASCFKFNFLKTEMRIARDIAHLDIIDLYIAISFLILWIELIFAAIHWKRIFKISI